MLSQEPRRSDAWCRGICRRFEAWVEIFSQDRLGTWRRIPCCKSDSSCRRAPTVAAALAGFTFMPQTGSFARAGAGLPICASGAAEPGLSLGACPHAARLVIRVEKLFSIGFEPGDASLAAEVIFLVRDNRERPAARSGSTIMPQTTSFTRSKLFPSVGAPNGQPRRFDIAKQEIFQVPGKLLRNPVHETKCARSQSRLPRRGRRDR